MPGCVPLYLGTLYSWGTEGHHWCVSWVVLNVARDISSTIFYRPSGFGVASSVITSGWWCPPSAECVQ